MTHNHAMTHDATPTLTRTARLVLLQVVGLLLAGYVTVQDRYIFWNPVLFHDGDVWLYYRCGSLLTQGLLPYRDFPLEYPPLANVAFVLPLLPVAFRQVSYPTYVWLLLVANTALSAFGALLIARLLPAHSKSRLGLYVGLVILCAPLIPWRYDLFPALLTLLGFYAVLRKRPGMAGMWLGFGIAAKLYPAVLLPVFVAFYWVNRDRRSVVRLLLACGGAVLAGVLPFLGAGAKMLYFVQYHQHRGIEFESLPAGIILLAQQFGLTDAQIFFNFGAFHLVSSWAAPLLRVLPFVFVLTFGLVLTCAFKRFRADHQAHGQIPPGTLVRWVVAALLAFIVTNKVFSPQYVIWLLPFVPFLPRRSAALMAVIFALTIALFPFSLGPLLDLHLWAVLLLNLRNLLAVAALCDLLLSIPRPLLPTMDSETIAEESR